jgi:ubiquinone/menaquinone biosynthesis C-methylase UbiE
MLAITRAKLAAGGVTNCDLVEGDAYAIAELVRTQAHFVLMANTFHGVPDKPRLVRAVAAVLKPGGEFAVINWHRRPREETTVLGRPRGPKTHIRMEPLETAATITGSDLTLARVVELPPYHYAAIFRRI